MIFISMLGANGGGCLFVNISTESARRREKKKAENKKAGVFLLLTNIVWICDQE